MFIVAGKLKGKRISVPSRLKVTEARVKEALFNIIMPEVFKGEVVLDLFAGSGALGIEALSWGAEKSIFVEKDPSRVRIIRKNLKCLNLESQGEVYCSDAFAFMRKYSRCGRKAWVIFLDPPYRQRLTTKSLKGILKYDILASSGFVIGLSFFREEVEEAGFFCLFKRRYGDRVIRIFQYQQDDNNLSGNF